MVPGLVPEDGTFLMFAPSGHYKTTLVLLILVQAANGRALDGAAIDPVPLIIVANEDAHGVKLRLRALAEQYELSLELVRVISTGDFKLDLPDERQRLLATARQPFSASSRRSSSIITTLA